MGDLLQFGQSTRLYLVNGPEALARPEVEEEELQAYRVERGKVRAWREGRRRRKEEQEGKVGEGELLEEGDEGGGGGVSWGMAEDAVEEEGEEGEEGREEGGRKAELPDYLKNLPEHQRRSFERGREGGMGMITVDESEVHEKDRKLFERLRAKVLKVEHMEGEMGRIYAKENSQVRSCPSLPPSLPPSFLPSISHCRLKEQEQELPTSFPSSFPPSLPSSPPSSGRTDRWPATSCSPQRRKDREAQGRGGRYRRAD